VHYHCIQQHFTLLISSNEAPVATSKSTRSPGRTAPHPRTANHAANNGTSRHSSNGTRRGATRTQSAALYTGQSGAELQAYGTIVSLPNSLDRKACESSVRALNQLLADTITLRDLYKKHHWQVAGPTFYQLHLLFDKHYEEQDALVDMIAERIQLLGGIALAMAPDIAETTRIPRPPRGREPVPVQISRLLAAHEMILKFAHDAAKKADDSGDDGTNDLVVSNIIRTNELQVWFVGEHVVDEPLVDAE
jgi:starvation-inducible DNA-binding protein